MKNEFPQSRTNLQRFIDQQGRYRLLILAGGALGPALADAHGLRDGFRTLFVQAVHAAALQSADLKQTMRQVLQIKWPDGGLSVEAGWQGHIRGYARNPEKIEEQFQSDEVLGGTMALIRLIGSHPGYTGYGSIFGFNLASALQSHYSTSEQRESYFHFADDFAAMIQRLPDTGGNAGTQKHTPDEILLQEHFEALVPRLNAVLTADDKLLASDFSLTRLSSEERLISCGCSREKISAYVRGLERTELQSMYEEGPWPVVVNCDNCASSYEFSRDEIRDFLE